MFFSSLYVPCGNNSKAFSQIYCPLQKPFWKKAIISTQPGIFIAHFAAYSLSRAIIIHDSAKLIASYIRKTLFTAIFFDAIAIIYCLFRNHTFYLAINHLLFISTIAKEVDSSSYVNREAVIFTTAYSTQPFLRIRFAYWLVSEVAITA